MDPRIPEHLISLMSAARRKSQDSNIRELLPKNAVPESPSVPRVQLSKDWKLPPRHAPRKRQSSLVNLEPQNEFDKKRIQNCNAQRSFRERQMNKVRNLESTIDNLRASLRNWKSRYEAVHSSMKELQKSHEREMEELRSHIDNLAEENIRLNTALLDQTRLRQGKSKHQFTKSTYIARNINEQILKNNEHDEVEILSFSDETLLKTMISNFKPMKAVALTKKSKLEEEQISTVLPNSRESSAIALRVPISEETEKPRCGFCDDNTACLCHDD